MLFAHSFNRIFPYPMAPDGSDGGGTAAGGAGNDNPANNGGDLEKRLLDAFAGIANKQGGADAAGVLLLQENKQYRDRISQLQNELATAQGKLPGEGAVVLTSEQAAEWQTYQELGKPDDLKQLKGNYTQLQRDKLFQEAAAAHGFKPAVLSNLKGIDDFQIEVREQEVDGKKVKVAVAKNGDGQERPLPQLIDEKWADFKPALVEKAAAPTGTPWPKQDVSSPSGATSTTDQYLERQRKAQESRKNPITGE